MKQAFILMLAACVLTACGRSSPSNFYLLESGITAMQVESMANKSLRVAQVETSGYLQRNNIVSRVAGQNKLILADFHLWAEPVGNGVRRVLEEILLEPMLAAGVNVLPPATEERGDYTLLLDVQRLDGNFHEKAVLESWWTLLNRDDKPIARGMYSASEMVNGDTYDALVAVESQLVRNFGQYLAQRLAAAMSGKSGKSGRE